MRLDWIRDDSISPLLFEPRESLPLRNWWRLGWCTWFVCVVQHIWKHRRDAWRWRRAVKRRCALDYMKGCERGPDTENRILTYYDEPVAAPGRAAAPVDSRSSVQASEPLSTSARSRPGDSTTRYGCWYRPPCRYPSPECRTPLTQTWTILICAAPDLVPLCTGPRRTAIGSTVWYFCSIIDV